MDFKINLALGHLFINSGMYAAVDLKCGDNVIIQKSCKFKVI